MGYLVLARKWRPQRFDEVTGQEHVTRTLRNAIEMDRVAHAYLFAGARGVGKTTTARILARALNCAEGPTTEPCGTCASCTEIAAGTSMDVMEIDGASNRGIAEVRELREAVRYAPSRDRFKVCIIDEVHMLTQEAFNALLKTLEEPPAHVVFIFATTEPHRIPVTILSRCQRFDFRRVPVSVLVAHLERILKAEGITADAEVLDLVAEQADGSVRDALSLLDRLISCCAGHLDAATVREVLGVADRRLITALAAAALDNRPGDALAAVAEAHEHGQELGHLATQLAHVFRDLAVRRLAGEQRAQQLGATQLDEALLERAARRTPLELHRMFEIALQAAERVPAAPLPRLAFEVAVVRLCHVRPMVPIDEVIRRLEAMATKQPPRQPSPASAPAAVPRVPPAGATRATASPPPSARATAAPKLDVAAERSRPAPAPCAATAPEPAAAPRRVPATGAVSTASATSAPLRAQDAAFPTGAVAASAVLAPSRTEPSIESEATRAASGSQAAAPVESGTAPDTAASAPPPDSLETVEAFLASLRAAHPHLAALLAQASWRAVPGGYEVTTPAPSVAVEFAADSPSVRAVEEALASHFGRPLRLAVRRATAPVVTLAEHRRKRRHEADARRRARIEADPRLRRLVEALDGTIERIELPDERTAQRRADGDSP